MISSDYKQLMDLLIQRTKEGKVNWQQSVAEAEFIVYFKERSLTIFTGVDQQSNEDFVAFVLRDKNGKEIDRFWVDQGDLDYQEMQALYLSARRTALDIDKTIRALTEELKSGKKIGLETPPEGSKPSPKIDDLPF